MNCPQCNREIPNGSSSCKYCNKLKEIREKEIVCDKPGDDLPTLAKKRENALKKVLNTIDINVTKDESEKERKPKDRKLRAALIALSVAVIIIIVLFICLADAQSQLNTTSSENSSTSTQTHKDKIIEYFQNVEAMRKAIKNDPHKYEGMRVSVSGEIVEKYNRSYSSDYVTLSSSTVKVYFEDSLKFSVLEKKDVIVVDGVISIQSDGTIQINEASYTFKKTMSDQQVSHQDEKERYVLTFSMRDVDGDNIAASGTVRVKITNDDGDVVYEKTHEFDEDDFQTWYADGDTVGKYKATIYISDSEIAKGSCESGKISFTVISENYKFEECTLTINGLPQETAE